MPKLTKHFRVAFRALHDGVHSFSYTPFLPEDVTTHEAASDFLRDTLSVHPYMSDLQVLIKAVAVAAFTGEEPDQATWDANMQKAEDIVNNIGIDFFNDIRSYVLKLCAKYSILETSTVQEKARMDFAHEVSRSLALHVYCRAQGVEPNRLISKKEFKAMVNSTIPRGIPLSVSYNLNLDAEKFLTVVDSADSDEMVEKHKVGPSVDMLFESRPIVVPKVFSWTADKEEPKCVKIEVSRELAEKKIGETIVEKLRKGVNINLA